MSMVNIIKLLNSILADMKDIFGIVMKLSGQLYYIALCFYVIFTNLLLCHKKLHDMFASIV